MAFTEPQLRKLKAKLDDKHVRTRTNNGLGWSYIEGWHAIAEANRIFGYDGWDRRTLDIACLATELKGEAYHAAYRAKVRVTVRAGETLIVREGSGTGEAKAATPGQAHELALKGAETDATKRALATFGNPFGLSLYDNGPRKPQANGGAAAPEARGPWRLRSNKGVFVASFDMADGFAAALQDAMSKAGDIEQLFEIWERNVETVRAIHRVVVEQNPGFGKRLVTHLKSCSIALVKPSADAPRAALSDAGQSLPAEQRHKIDKSALTIGAPKRHRSREHLRFVARQPCLICGRSPSQAHHVRFAQPKGLGLKVSDEFTVPLCAIHHMENHATGDERNWWATHKIDPLFVAQSLWKQSTGTVQTQHTSEAE